MDELINQMIIAWDEPSYIQHTTWIDKFELIKKYLENWFWIEETINKWFEKNDVRTIVTLNEDQLIQNYIDLWFSLIDICDKLETNVDELAEKWYDYRYFDWI